MTNDEAKAIMAGLISAFRVDLQTGTMEVWRDMLQPMDYELAAEAMHQVIKFETRFPAPAEFRSYFRAAQRRRNTHVPRLPESPETRQRRNDRNKAHLTDVRAVLHRTPPIEPLEETA